MDKQIAISQLQDQFEKIRLVRATRRFGASFTKWRRDTEVVISQVWLAVRGLLLTAFLIGVNSTRISIIREIFHLDKLSTTIQNATTK